MTERLEAGRSTTGSERAWTCARCAMTLRWTPEAENPVLPSTWVEEDDGLYCLSCRRDRAGDEAIGNLPSDTPASDRARAGSQGRLEFEIRRDPERPDNRIAKACRTSTPAVRRARARLGL